MRFKIEHQIEYKYDKPVFFEPHTFYMRPREHDSQKLNDFTIFIDPEPLMTSWTLDAFGNRALRAWFEGRYDYLRLRTRLDVETYRKNPFNYLPDTRFDTVRIGYPKAVESYLRPYWRNDENVTALEVMHFAETVALKSGNQVTSFLPALCQEIFTEFKKIKRKTPGYLSPEETLQRREGACRDLAMLFIACCDSQNLAARFVSGYYEGNPEVSEKDLHGWAEVYIEGGGWRGFDPSSGLAINESYVPVAASPLPELVAPVVGTFRGDNAASRLSPRIVMEPVTPL